MAVDWWKVAAGAASGYAGADAAGSAAKAITGSLLNRRKKKKSVSSTPSMGPDPGDEASAEAPYQPMWEDEGREDW